MNQLKLFFSQSSNPQLERVEFTHSLAGGKIISTRGKDVKGNGVSGTFQWSSAVQALTLLLVNYSVDDSYELIGGKGSLASSLDYAISKRPVWLQDMFGVDSNGTSLIRRICTLRGAGQKSDRPVSILVNKNFLTQDAIVLYLDGLELNQKTYKALLGAALSTSVSNLATTTSESASLIQILNAPKLTDSYQEVICLKNVNHAHEELYKILAMEDSQEVVIENIGLDWETTWPRFKYDILDAASFSNITVKSLVISDKNDFTCKWTDGQWNRCAGNAVKDAVSYLAVNAERLANKNITFEARTYTQSPVIHGFLVNKKYLFFSTTFFRYNKLYSGDVAYLFFHPQMNNSLAYQSYIEIYSSWFDFLWQNGSKVGE